MSILVNVDKTKKKDNSEKVFEETKEPKTVKNNNENETITVSSDLLKTEEVNIKVKEKEKEKDEENKAKVVDKDKDNVVENKKKVEKQETDSKQEYITICVDFPKHATPVECIITATGYHDKIAASGRELRLLQNRLYMIPVDCDESINSDEWTDIKVMSDMSSLIDVRYIKDGLACVMPLTHNVKIRQGNRLAILW